MLKHRVISGCALGAVFLVALNVLPTIVIWLLLVAVSCLAQLEFYTLMNRGGIPVFRMLGIVCGAVMISVTFLSTCGSAQPLAASYKWESFALFGALIAVFLRQFPQKLNAKPLETMSCTILGICYVPFLLNYLTRIAFAWDSPDWNMRMSETSRDMALFLILVVKSSDIGAYFVGSRWGRNKLMERISPGKTWEGLSGGIAASLIVCVAFLLATGWRIGRLAVNPLDALVLGVTLPVAGVVGDMFESLIKRSTGSKDSSTAIPGMGGLLDVLDSLLFSAPLMYLYARAFL